ncbi:MAG: AMP-binding protein [Hyphomonadaceae bacterium]|nr:AMP-binding protein [Hyphomonadaceae bacterium]
MRATPYVSPVRIDIERRDDGTLLLTNPHPLRDGFANAVAPLPHWAATLPDRLWLAGTDPVADRMTGRSSGWRSMTYRQGWSRVQALARGLLAQFKPGDVIAVATGNSLDHALLTYAAMLAGMVIAPITPAYALKARDPRRLHEALALVGARAVLVDGAGIDGAATRAAAWVADAGLITLTTGPAAGLRRAMPLQGLFQETGAAPDPAAIKAEAPAKYMLTSGSTGSPKAVIITHANLARNAAQIRSTFDPELEAGLWPDGIIMANHLPWSHSLGGNAVFHMLTTAGVSLWIDPGSPTPEGLPATVATLKQVRPNYHLTVPLGWALLAGALESDPELAPAFFERLSIMQYGGASLTQDVYQRLQASAVATCGEEITVAAGYGATETAPTVCNVHWPNRRMGLVGLPVPGLSLKLVPVGDRMEARVKGPGITPGYLGEHQKTAEAYDHEGYYLLGDALKFAEPDSPEVGLAFDGRLSETFKLANGSWVPVGTVRLALVAGLGGLISDAVICGEGADGLTALGFLNLKVARDVAGDDSLDLAALSTHPAVIEAANTRLAACMAGKPATQAVIAIRLLPDHPSLEDGEITDKGYLNQARCRQNRNAA